MISLKNENQLVQIIRQYSSEDNDIVESLLALEEKVRRPRLIMPVLGTQGTGKSTLINALIGEDILPGEADETTCVPVEIRYGQQPNGEVFFKNSNSVESVSKKGDLARYVDNQFNPGNKLKVDHILLLRNNSLLKTGATIVDLPGVGSLTQENESTTMEYIKNCVVAIFLISTCPPILKREADFIRRVWRGVNSAFFVQNIWDDDSPQEVNDGREHNEKVIKEIARELKVDAVKPIPVNIYAAAKGVFTGDESMIEKSQLPELIGEIQTFSSNYSEKAERDYDRRVLNAVIYISGVLEENISKAKMSVDELREKLILERKNFEEVSKALENENRSLLSTINDTRQELRKFAEDKKNHYSELLKRDIYHLIDNGVVDGEQLSDAFSDKQSQYSEQAIEEASEMLEDILETVYKEFEKFTEKIKQEMCLPDAVQFNKEQAIKWEKGLNFGINIGGGVVAAFLLGDLAAKLVGGLALGAFAGPAGIAAALLVGAAVCIFANKIGKKARDKIAKERAREVKREIDPYIKQFGEKLKESICGSYDESVKIVKSLLEEYLKARDAHLEKIMENIKDLEQHGNKYMDEQTMMELHLEYLDEWRGKHEQMA